MAAAGLNNLTGLLFAANEGSFLAGVAAALKSTPATSASSAVSTPALIHNFQVGYEAGAKAAKPDIKIDIQYISPEGDFSGFSDPAKGKIVAKGMYDGGADIVFQVAGGSGLGVFRPPRPNKRAIGVDSDQCQTVETRPCRP